MPDVDNAAPYLQVPGQPVQALDRKRVEDVSQRVGALLSELCPEVVAAAEGFAKDLRFIPVSATGLAPEVDPESGALGIRPRDLAPYWAEVPVLYAIHNWAHGLIGARYKSEEIAK